MFDLINTWNSYASCPQCPYRPVMLIAFRRHQSEKTAMYAMTVTRTRHGDVSLVSRQRREVDFYLRHMFLNQTLSSRMRKLTLKIDSNVPDLNHCITTQ